MNIIEYLQNNIIHVYYPHKEPFNRKENNFSYAEITISMNDWNIVNKFIPAKSNIKEHSINFNIIDESYDENIEISVSGIIKDYKKTKFGDIILIMKDLKIIENS